MRHTAFLVLCAILVIPANAVDLGSKYKSTLDFDPKSRGYEWKSEATDVWRLKQFNLAWNDEFQVTFGPSQVVFGRHESNVLWAAVFPKSNGDVVKAKVGQGEKITSAWLRFHPSRVGELFPADTVVEQGDAAMVERAKQVADFKILSSYHIGQRATVPRERHLIVDCEMSAGIRRFWVIDSDKKSVQYIDAFRSRTLPVAKPLADGGAVEIFDKVWNAFDREYAMFAVKPNVNWQKLRDEYRPRAATARDNRSLGKILSELLDDLEDLHVHVKVEGKPIPGYSRDRPLNGNPGAIEHLIGPMHETRWNIAWGRTKDGLGYINVDGLQDDELPEQFETALRSMADTRGVIVDLRFNGGGSELLARQVAGCFLDRERVYAMSQYRSGPSHDELTKKFKRSFKPHARWYYTGPVVALHGQKTMSSAEAFALMMRQCPGVSTMGDRTAGSSGNPRQINAGAGIVVNMSRWIPLDSNGKSFDAVGIKPDVLVKAEADDFKGTNDPVLRAALEHLRKSEKPEGPVLQARPGYSPPRELIIRLDPVPEDLDKWRVSVSNVGVSAAESKFRGKVVRSGDHWRALQIPNGRFVVRCHPPAKGANAYYPAIEIAVEQTDLTPSVTLRRGSASIHGAFRANGEPVKGGFVSCACRDDWRKRDAVVAAVDENGEYRVDGLRPGRYRIQVGQWKGYELRRPIMPQVFDVEIKAGENLLTPKLASGRIEGQVIGKTIAPREKLLQSLGNILVTRCDDQSSILHAHIATHEDGRFVLSHVPPGKYVLRYFGNSIEDCLSTVVTVAESKMPAQVRLSASMESGAIAGHVEGLEKLPPEENPFRDAVRVVAFRKTSTGIEFCDRSRQTRVERPTANFRIETLPAGKWAVMAERWTRPYGTQVVWLGDVDVVKGKESILNFDLPMCGDVELTVEIGDRKPSRFRWYLETSKGIRIPDLGISVNSTYSVPLRLQLPAGEYHFHAQFGDLGTSTTKFVVGESLESISVPIRPPGR